MYFIINLIAKKAETKAEIKANSKKDNSEAEKSAIFILKTLDKEAPKIIGIDKRKENLTAASLFNLLAKPAKIVIPDLEVPGMMAMA